MKILYKKGVTIVALTVTVMVLAIITLMVFASITDINTVINIKTKSELVSAINNAINIERVKKDVKNEGASLTYEDIKKIVKKYGKYNEQDMSILTKNGITVWLYEVTELPIENLVNISYSGGVFTAQSDFTNLGYIIEYKINYSAWQKYTSGINITDEDTIYIRLKNPNSVIISSNYILDQHIPQIKITPNGATNVRSKEITIDIIDNGKSGLSNTNKYEYYLSTSNITQQNGAWLSYEIGIPFTIGSGMNGTYYLHVREVKDNVGNSSQMKISNPFVFNSASTGS